MKKTLFFLLLCTVQIYGQTSNGSEQEFDYGIKNNSTQTITTPPYLTTTGMDGTQGKIPSALIEKTDNKQNSLAVDGTGTKYPTVDAVNAKVSNIDNTSDANKPVSTATQTQLNGKAPSTGGTGYIQNQNASDQSANMWISGDVKARGGAFSSYVDALGTVSSGNNFIANTGGLYFNGYNNYNAGIFPNTSGTGLSFQTGGNIALNLVPSGAATFSSTVTATSFNGSATLTGTPTAPTAPAGTTGNQIATLDYVLANSGANSGATSGTYAPTLTNGLNVTSYTLATSAYTKIGNIVTVTVTLYISVEAAVSPSMVTISLPFNRSTSGNDFVCGSGTAIPNSSNTCISAFFKLKNNTTEVALFFYPVASGGNTLTGTFSYSI